MYGGFNVLLLFAKSLPRRVSERRRVRSRIELDNFFRASYGRQSVATTSLRSAKTFPQRGTYGFWFISWENCDCVCARARARVHSESITLLFITLTHIRFISLTLFLPPFIERTHRVTSPAGGGVHALRRYRSRRSSVEETPTAHPYSQWSIYCVVTPQRRIFWWSTCRVGGLSEGVVEAPPSVIVAICHEALLVLVSHYLSLSLSLSSVGSSEYIHPFNI